MSLCPLLEDLYSAKRPTMNFGNKGLRTSFPVPHCANCPRASLVILRARIVHPFGSDTFGIARDLKHRRKAVDVMIATLTDFPSVFFVLEGGLPHFNSYRPPHAAVDGD